jgi:hypothetical protein
MSKSKSRSKPVSLPIIHAYAAGIDIGSRFHVVAVSPDLCDEPVQDPPAALSAVHGLPEIPGHIAPGI